MIQFDSIAGYRIVRPLGEGGMGRVYEALQTEPLRRRVALKVLRSGGGDAAARRFDAERQALAVMDHPGIAKVFDAGITDDGRRWFAMELVAGRNLTAFADASALTLSERVTLFERVCNAVQHAHQKGVIHRDLKPSNVLVAEDGEAPTPKVIDFGVAKALDLRLADDTLVTQFGAVIGTPAYMSPEQADATSFDIDTRADVYSLGVMLYELLVGSLPVDPVETGYPGFISYLKSPDTPPPRPGDRFKTLDPERQRVAARVRSTEPAHLRQRLGGDLEWVVMTAIEKERTRRYESAGALAEDLRRVLQRRPVVARPPDRAYLLRRFVSRHRVPVAAGIAVALALTSGAAAATFGMLRAQREAAVAQREARTAARVSDFMSAVFAEADPQQARGREVTVREALDQGANRVRTELADEPLIQMRLMRSIGQAYRGLGLFAEARPQLEDALSLAERFAELPLDVATLQHDLGYLLTFLSEFERADSLLLASLVAFEGVEGPGSDWTTTIVANLAFNRLRWGRGIAQADSLLAVHREPSVDVLGEVHPKVALAAYLRCWTLRELGRRTEALAACSASLTQLKAALGEDAPQVVFNTLAIGHTLRALGQWGGARDAYREAEVLNRRLHPGGHPETAYALQATAESFRNEGHLDSALVHADEAVAMLSRTLGPSSTQLAEGSEVLARVLMDLGRFDEAEALFREVLAIDSARIGIDSQRYATHLSGFGALQLRRGDVQTARATQRRALEIMERAESPTIRLVAARMLAGEAARANGEPGTAVELLMAAFQATQASPADFPVERARIGGELSLALLAEGEVDRACDVAREVLQSPTSMGRPVWGDEVEARCSRSSDDRVPPGGTLP